MSTPTKTPRPPKAHGFVAANTAFSLLSLWVDLWCFAEVVEPDPNFKPICWKISAYAWFFGLSMLIVGAWLRRRAQNETKCCDNTIPLRDLRSKDQDQGPTHEFDIGRLLKVQREVVSVTSWAGMIWFVEWMSTLLIVFRPTDLVCITIVALLNALGLFCAWIEEVKLRRLLMQPSDQPEPDPTQAVDV
jgi:hypothetical protein